MKKYFLLFTCMLLIHFVSAQKQRADSIGRLLAAEKVDSNKAKYMWQKANYQYTYAPDSAIIIAQQSLLLSTQIKYAEGESRALGQMANGFLSIGNYTRALEFYIKKLQLEEKRNSPYNLASAIMNIGIVYVYQEEYDKAILYFNKADSLITANNITQLAYNIKLNIGDAYDKQNMTDSAYFYFDKASHIAASLQDKNRIGMAMTGLAHTYLLQHHYPQATQNYYQALAFLTEENNEDIMCEAALGLANLYKATNRYDSAIWFARYSFTIAQGAGFQSRQLDAANFLTQAFSEMKASNDSALIYLQRAKIIGDSINSRQKIREAQVISINEQLRQDEISVNLQRLKKERAQQLQLLLIGLFIPVLFLITLLLSRIKVHVRIISFLGILSLLILFEYLTLLLHPVVVELTHHTPFLELLIFVTIASLLIPAHHRIEHWLIQKLTVKKSSYTDGYFKIKRQRLKRKNIPK